MSAQVEKDPRTQLHGIMDEMPVAHTYAEAFWNLAKKSGQPEEVVAEFDAFVNETQAVGPQAEAYFRLASVTHEQRATLLEQKIKPHVSDLLYRFLRALNEHDRLGLLATIRVRMRQLVRAHRGKTTVWVRSAVELTESQQETLAKKLAGNFGIDPELHLVVAPQLIGGLWIQIGESVYDSTVRWNLNRLRESMLARSSHEIQSG